GAGSRPDEVAAADLNGDGKLDLAVGDDADPGLSVLMGNGDGTFKAAVTFSVGFPVPFAAVGDFNGDGRLDLAGVNTGGSGVFVLLQTPTISLSKTSLTFTDQLVGTTSTAGTVTLGNTSGLLLKIGSVAVTGTNATDFGQANTCGTGLAPG